MDSSRVSRLKATWFRDRLAKKASKGFQGYPVASIAFYGPDDRCATKVAVGITSREGAEVGPLERWYADSLDVRQDPTIAEQILHFIQQHGVKSLVSPDRILGCPHEEGIDYPEGSECPTCEYWRGRDRFTGLLVAPRHDA